MSRSAAEKISILERTLARVLKHAGSPRPVRVAGRPAPLAAAPPAASVAPAAPPVTAVAPTPTATSASAEHRSVTRELDFSPPSAAVGSAPPVEARAESTPPEAFSPSPTPPPVVEARPATLVPPVEARTAPPPAEAPPVPRPTADMEVLEEEDVMPASERKRSRSQELEVTHGAADDEEVERALPPRSFQPEPPPESVVQVDMAAEPAVERMSTRPPPGMGGEPSRPPQSSSDDLEADVPQRAPAAAGPSDAQLGATIELEEGPHQALELAPSLEKKTPPPPPPEEEEVLPAAQAPGRFAAGLRPSGEVAAVQARGGDQPAIVIEQPSGDRPTPLPSPPPERDSQPPGSAPRPRPSSPPGVRLAVPSSPPLYQPPRSGPPPAPVALEVSAQVVGRMSMHGEASRFVEATRRSAPATFGEMLDDALALGG